MALCLLRGLGEQPGLQGCQGCLCLLQDQVGVLGVEVHA